MLHLTPPLIVPVTSFNVKPAATDTQSHHMVAETLQRDTITLVFGITANVSVKSNQSPVFIWQRRERYQMPKVLEGHKHMATLSIIEPPLLAELQAHT